MKEQIQSMKKWAAVNAVLGVLVLCGCGGGSGGKVETVRADFDDVVMDASGVEPAEEAAPVPVPGDAPPAPEAAANGEAALLATMTVREKQELEEKNRPIIEAAQTEAANNSILLNDVQKAVEEYHFDNRKPPASLAELIKGGYLEAVPKIPAGKKLRIDGKTLRVILE